MDLQSDPRSKILLGIFDATFGQLHGRRYERVTVSDAHHLLRPGQPAQFPSRAPQGNLRQVLLRRLQAEMHQCYDVGLELVDAFRVHIAVERKELTRSAALLRLLKWI